MDKIVYKDIAICTLDSKNKAMSNFKIGGYYTIKCFDKYGNLKWQEHEHNMFVDEGINHILDVVFTSTSADAGIYVGLMDDGGAPVAGDTMASQTNWSEATPYSESVRQTWTPNGAASSKSLSNSSSKASFSINATDTVGGAFLSNDNTKGGTSGKLFCAVQFSANRGVASGDTITIQYDLSADDS